MLLSKLNFTTFKILFLFSLGSIFISCEKDNLENFDAQNVEITQDESQERLEFELTTALEILKSSEVPLFINSISDLSKLNYAFGENVFLIKEVESVLENTLQGLDQNSFEPAYLMLTNQIKNQGIIMGLQTLSSASYNVVFTETEIEKMTLLADVLSAQLLIMESKLNDLQN